MRPDTQDYAYLLLNRIPLMDVRAPVEFARGAFPGAVNQPLMNDEERHQVGICYKKHGQQAAIELGNRLVSGAIKTQRLAHWLQFAQTHPQGYIYCFRGGLRSHITQQWLWQQAGVRYPLVEGGYKALRQFLLQQIEQLCQPGSFIVLGGLTGTGKTELLQQLSNGIDLEGHANHRGSSFGKHASAQPSQINFENAFAIDLLQKQRADLLPFIVEDESRLIGNCYLPLPLQQCLAAAPMVWLEDSLDNRIERILHDYVVNLCAEFTQQYGLEAGNLQYAQRLLQSLDKIRKRLGSERHANLRGLMLLALQQQLRHQDHSLHRAWIHGLLTQYYDPMYEHQRQLKQRRVIFRGCESDLRHYLSTQKTPLA